MVFWPGSQCKKDDLCQKNTDHRSIGVPAPYTTDGFVKISCVVQ